MRELRVLRKPLLLAVPGMEQATIHAHLLYHIDADKALQERFNICH